MNNAVVLGCGRRFLGAGSILLQTVLVGLALIICCLLSSTRIAATVSAVAFAVYLVVLWLHRPHFTVKYFGFIFGAAFNVAGCVAIEFSNIYLSRMGSYSGFVGSLPLIATAQWVFLVCICCLDKSFGVEAAELAIASSSSNGLKLLELGTYLFIVGCAVCFLSVVDSPVFITGNNRFEYLEHVFNPGIRYLVRILSFAFVVPLMYFHETKKKAGLFGLAFYCLFLFWTGTKFGTYMTMLLIGLLVYYRDLLELDGKRVVALMGKVMIVVALLGCMAVVAHEFSSDVSASRFIPTRLSGQGELWWKTYSLTGGVAHIDDLDTEVEALFNSSDRITDNVGSKHGIYGIMYLTAPKKTVDSVLSQGWRFTEAGFAAAYYYFGIAGPILYALLTAPLVVLLQNALLRALSSLFIIKSVALVYISSLVNTALGMFLFSSLVKPQVLLAIICISIHTEYVKSRRRKSYRLGYSSQIFNTTGKLANGRCLI